VCVRGRNKFAKDGERMKTVTAICEQLLQQQDQSEIINAASQLSAAIQRVDKSVKRNTFLPQYLVALAVLGSNAYQSRDEAAARQYATTLKMCIDYNAWMKNCQNKDTHSHTNRDLSAALFQGTLGFGAFFTYLILCMISRWNDYNGQQKGLPILYMCFVVAAWIYTWVALLAGRKEESPIRYYPNRICILLFCICFEIAVNVLALNAFYYAGDFPI